MALVLFSLVCLIYILHQPVFFYFEANTVPVSTNADRAAHVQFSSLLLYAVCVEFYVLTSSI
jgi:hypothetical protein